MLDPGYGVDAAAAAGASTMRPFGRALCLREAPYWVMPGWLHGLTWALFQVPACAWILSLCQYQEFLYVAGYRRSPVD